MSEQRASWARIMAPVVGGDVDAGVLQAAAVIAGAFEAELAAVFAPADVADVLPWIGEGFMGGIQVTAIESLKEAAVEGERLARAWLEACDYQHKAFVALSSPVWSGMALESRLSDLVVFDDSAARGRGPLGETFQQMIAEEQRPVLVVRQGLQADGCVAIAWDGGKEASRAVRTALPLLHKAHQVVILTAPAATSREFDPQRLVSFLGGHGVTAEVRTLTGSGDAAGLLLEGARQAAANLLVAGAFGHPRLQEFIFGGTTRSLLAAEGGPSLFLSH